MTELVVLNLRLAPLSTTSTLRRRVEEDLLYNHYTSVYRKTSSVWRWVYVLISESFLDTVKRLVFEIYTSTPFSRRKIGTFDVVLIDSK